MNPLTFKIESETRRVEEPPPVWQGRPAWSEYLFLLFFTLVSAVRALIAVYARNFETGVIYSFGALFFIGLAHFLRATTRYTLTRGAVRRTAGFLGKGEKSRPLGTIRSVAVEQGPMDRLFGIGTVVLLLKEGNRRESLRGIRDPEVICRKIEALL